MPSTIRRLRPIAAALAVAAGTAHGQTADKPTPLAPVVVQAEPERSLTVPSIHRAEQEIRLTPGGASVVDPRTYETGRASTLSDALQYATGRLRAAAVRRRRGAHLDPRLGHPAHVSRPRHRPAPGRRAAQPRRRQLRHAGGRAARPAVHRGVPRLERAPVRRHHARRRDQFRRQHRVHLRSPAAAGRARQLRLLQGVRVERRGEGQLRLEHHGVVRLPGRLPRLGRAGERARLRQLRLAHQPGPGDALLSHRAQQRFAAAGDADEGASRVEPAPGERRQPRRAPEARLPALPHRQQDHLPERLRNARGGGVLLVQGPVASDLPGDRPGVERLRPQPALRDRGAARGTREPLRRRLRSAVGHGQRQPVRQRAGPGGRAHRRLDAGLVQLRAVRGELVQLHAAVGRRRRRSRARARSASWRTTSSRTATRAWTSATSACRRRWERSTSGRRRSTCSRT